MAPPAALMMACVETPTALDVALQALDEGAVAIPAVTNADLIRKIRALRLDLKVCNTDKAALRGWVEDMGKTPP